MTELVDLCRYSFDCLRVWNMSVKCRSLDYSIQKIERRLLSLKEG